MHDQAQPGGWSTCGAKSVGVEVLHVRLGWTAWCLDLRLDLRLNLLDLRLDLDLVLEQPSAQLLRQHLALC